MKRTTIRLGQTMKGKVDVSTPILLIPFSTRNSHFPKKWGSVTKYGKLVFELTRDGKGGMEYSFSGVDLMCYCNDCLPHSLKKKK